MGSLRDFQRPPSYVEATVAGFLDFDKAKKEIRSLHLVNDEAAYGGGKFAIGVRDGEG